MTNAHIITANNKQLTRVLNAHIHKLDVQCKSQDIWHLPLGSHCVMYVKKHPGHSGFPLVVAM